jgi:dCMP deaminase
MAGVRKRPERNEYFMGIAMGVRARADCLGHKVGAVIVRDRRIISSGYNGTPEGMTNCSEGGCHRCAHRDQYPSGTGYDLCICVHAEQNALIAAARFGISIENATVYTTLRPCFGCTKEMLQAQIAKVFYLHPWVHPDADKQKQYEVLQARFPDGIQRLDMSDPDADWAVSKPAKNLGTPDEHGHNPL